MWHHRSQRCDGGAVMYEVKVLEALQWRLLTLDRTRGLTLFAVTNLW